MRKFNLSKIRKGPLIIFFALILLQALIGTISFRMLFNIKALQIVLSGIIIAILISFPKDVLVETYKTIDFCFNDEINFEYTINKIYNLSLRVKREGLLALKEDIEYEEDVFIKDVMILLNDYKSPEAIEDIMDHDIESRFMELLKPYKVMEMIANVAPAFGLIGTLVGMIGLLNTIHDPSSIMGNMAEALVSTLYGSLIANFFAFPIMARVQEYNTQKILEYRMIKEGILLIAKEDSTRNVFDKMNVMLKEEKRFVYPKTIIKESDKKEEKIVEDMDYIKEIGESENNGMEEIL